MDPVAPPQRRRRRRIIRALIITAALLAIAPLVALELGYQIEIARIPERPADPVPSLPPLVVRSLGVQLFETPDPQMTPIYPWTPLLAIARGGRPHLTAREAISVALSEMNFGAQTAGIDAAARRFFDKSAEDLDVGEIAELIAWTASPSIFRDRPDRLRGSRDALLRKLHDHGLIDEPTMQAAMERYVRRIK